MGATYQNIFYTDGQYNGTVDGLIKEFSKYASGFHHHDVDTICSYLGVREGTPFSMKTHHVQYASDFLASFFPKISCAFMSAALTVRNDRNFVRSCSSLVETVDSLLHESYDDHSIMKEIQYGMNHVKAYSLQHLGLDELTDLQPSELFHYVLLTVLGVFSCRFLFHNYCLPEDFMNIIQYAGYLKRGHITGMSKRATFVGFFWRDSLVHQTNFEVPDDILDDIEYPISTLTSGVFNDKIHHLYIWSSEQLSESVYDETTYRIEERAADNGAVGTGVKGSVFYYGDENNMSPYGALLTPRCYDEDFMSLELISSILRLGFPSINSIYSIFNDALHTSRFVRAHRDEFHASIAQAVINNDHTTFIIIALLLNHAMDVLVDLDLDVSYPHLRSVFDGHLSAVVHENINMGDYDNEEYSRLINEMNDVTANSRLAKEFVSIRNPHYDPKDNTDYMRINDIEYIHKIHDIILCKDIWKRLDPDSSIVSLTDLMPWAHNGHYYKMYYEPIPTIDLLYDTIKSPGGVERLIAFKKHTDLMEQLIINNHCTSDVVTEARGEDVSKLTNQTPSINDVSLRSWFDANGSLVTDDLVWTCINDESNSKRIAISESIRDYLVNGNMIENVFIDPIDRIWSAYHLSIIHGRRLILRDRKKLGPMTLSIKSINDDHDSMKAWKRLTAALM